MTINMRYDVAVDALAIEFQPGAEVARTISGGPGIQIDLDADGRFVTMEVLDASARVPREHLEELPSPKEFLTLSEAAEESGLAAATLRVQIHRGRLAAVKRGRDWLVDATALMNYLESRDRRGRRPARKQVRKNVKGRRKTVGRSKAASTKKRARDAA